MRLIQTLKRLPLLVALLFVTAFAVQLFSISQPVSAVTYNIGDAGPAGGLIFYIDDGTYYEVAPSDWSGGSDPTAQWGCHTTLLTGADGTAIGTGEQNTSDIITGCATVGIAARLADSYSGGGYDDWFLPSLDELNAMRQNLYPGSGGFAAAAYWSSSEHSIDRAWHRPFHMGSSYNDWKGSSFRVRPVRSFTETPSPTALESITVSASVVPIISLSTSGTIDLSITPTSGGAMSSASDTVTVSTNSSTGYDLSLRAETEQFSEMWAFGGTYIPAINATPVAPTALTNNTWGYRVDGAAGFGAGPTSAEADVTTTSYTWAGVAGALDTPHVLKSTSTPAEDDTTTIWYGAEIDTSKSADTYSIDMLYTAVSN